MRAGGMRAAREASSIAALRAFRSSAVGALSKALTNTANPGVPREMVFHRKEAGCRTYAAEEYVRPGFPAKRAGVGTGSGVAMRAATARVVAAGGGRGRWDADLASGTETTRGDG